MKRNGLILALALSFSGAAMAGPAATVEGLQMPVVLERGGTRVPLQSGMELRSGDVLHSGPGARVLLRLEEGSDVKLGENADLDLNTLQPSPEAQGVYKGILNVLKGAFRFTTSAVGKSRQRDIQARIATVTIGIRGTDVWGKAEVSRDFVVLLEGKISVRRESESAVAMETPLSLFMAPKGQAALPVGPVNPEELKVWAQETELQDGGGVIKQDGVWRLNLASYREAAAAQAMQQRLAAAGYATQINSAEVNGTTWERLSITSFATRADAERIAQKLAGDFGFTSPWVTK